MDFKDLEQRAQIRQGYEAFEKARYGRSWTDEEIALGFVGDVGDLLKLVQAKNGIRALSGDVDQLLAHELADCLWSLMVLTKIYQINLEQAFLQTMTELEEYLKKQSSNSVPPSP